jgi:hypothetical protein
MAEGEGDDGRRRAEEQRCVVGVERVFIRENTEDRVGGATKDGVCGVWYVEQDFSYD